MCNSTFEKVGNNEPQEASIRALRDLDKWSRGGFGYMKCVIGRRYEEKVIGKEKRSEM